MKYTQLHKYNNLWLELSTLKKNKVDHQLCEAHPSYFAHHFLNMTPYKYQHMILRRYRDNPKQKLRNNRLIVCKGRQMGLSFCFAWLAIWAAFCNKYPSGPHKDTKVAIVSRSDGQARKLMAEIQKLIFHSPMDLGDHVEKGRRTPLNKTEIHFKNGFIKCFPPTDAILGESIDLLIVDEAAMVEDEVYNTAMKPTTSKTNGKIILSSTPRGQKGFFFETFDPYDIRDKHEFVRYWFHWKMCEDPIQTRIIKDEYKNYKDIGNLKKFDQEYNGLFTVDQEAFFEDSDVEKGLDKELSTHFEFKDAPCSIGIDYGGSESATCITVVAKLKTQIITLFQFAKSELDLNLLTTEGWEHSIQQLCRRYDVRHIVVDDCAAGLQTNQKLENEGYPIQRFNFRSDQSLGDRNRGYYIFRSQLKKGHIKYPNFRDLMAEMKTIQEIEMEVNTRIKAPRNYRDDRIDSLMMSCYPFIAETGTFTSTVLDYKATEEKIEKNKVELTGREDPTWIKLNTKQR